jgi:alpha-glucosidase
VTVNGHLLAYVAKVGAVGWRFEGNTLTTVVTVAKTPVTMPIKVQVTRSAELFGRRAELEGFAGSMTRLREAYDTLNQTFPIAWSPDELTDVMQTGDRLSYRPELAGEQLKHYRVVLPQAIAKVNELAKPPSQAEIEALARRFRVDPNSEEVKKKAADFKDHVARAQASLADVPNAK